ncbi:hypothetical protein GCM10029978_064780 [Actinoallomurus acanthiterrae]
MVRGERDGVVAVEAAMPITRGWKIGFHAGGPAIHIEHGGDDAPLFVNRV